MLSKAVLMLTKVAGEGGDCDLEVGLLADPPLNPLALKKKRKQRAVGKQKSFAEISFLKLTFESCPPVFQILEEREWNLLDSRRSFAGWRLHFRRRFHAFADASSCSKVHDNLDE